MAKSKQKTKEKEFTPQQIKFAMFYYLPDSPTYGNARQSALRAGFSDKYSRNITVKNLNWIKDVVLEIGGKGVTKDKLVRKAKRVLDKSLDSEDEKIAQDTAKFIAKTTTEFSEKQDIVSNGETLTVATLEFVNGDNPKEG
nr:MAG TPA: terminase small subunit [Caudoviricetes sp.]